MRLPNRKSFRPLICFFLFFLAGNIRVYPQNGEKEADWEYNLPDPLICKDGSKVTSVKQWQEERRPEILEMATKLMYGRSPHPPKELSFKVFDQDEAALDGKAIRKQIRISLGEFPDGPTMNLLIYYPNNKEQSVPLFLGLNFEGNHSIHVDRGIRLSEGWVWAGAAGAVDNQPSEKSRGSNSTRWPVEMILERGFAVATVHASDIDPDHHDEFRNGIHALYPELQNRGDNFSTMAAWAWGLSRAMDYFEHDPALDSEKVAVLGFSRMGKAALWAGAVDERFALVISNGSGGGGAALSKRKVGEDIARLNNGNPHWFARNFRKFNNNEEALPFDQHMIITLVAPRPAYIASAIEDTGADPLGEFLAAKAAEPVYELFGLPGLPAEDFPPIDHPVHRSVGYHVRSGSHDITTYDWNQFLNFADKHFR